MRAALAVIAGFVLWTLLWLIGGAAVVRLASLDLEADRIDDAVPLVILIAISVVNSVLSGALTAWIHRRRCGAAVWSLAALLLLVGVGVEVSAWSMYPVWYHLGFLVLLAPATVAGGKLAAK